MRRLLLSGGAGLLFGLGLALSGMTQPGKVIAFLDVAGDWDPSLAFVMAGAIAVFAPLFRILTRRPHAALGLEWSLPNRSDVDPRLVVGSATFGVGWGLGGFCPGPGIVAAGTGSLTPLVFVFSMLAGMRLMELLHGGPVPTRAPEHSTQALEPQSTGNAGDGTP
ncbi:MAG: YeeE/YedE family protein [Myxococcales bacterium]|nr:YeeE/YedE family protein [Myxococcales bacterium]